MQFSEIIGQSAIKKRLIRSVKENRISHAQIFCGAEGVGKLALALAYAQYIHCENPSDLDSCGVCPSCIKYKKLVHPDLHFVYPIIRVGADEVCDTFLPKFRKIITENPYLTISQWYDFISNSGKQGLIYENESAQILKKMSLKSYEGSYKIMIIWGPEKMNVSCANKLLKLIEEPADKTLFLFVSDTPDQIISTIQSRLQRIEVPPIEDDVLSKVLKKEYSSIDDIDYLVRVSRGSYSEAMDVLARNNLEKPFADLFINLMRTAWKIRNLDSLTKKGDAVIELGNFAENMSKKGREYQKDFLEYSQRMIRENFIMNFKKDELNYITSSERTFFAKFSRYVNESNVIEIMQELQSAEEHIMQNVQAKLVFTDLGLKLIMFLKNS